MKRGSGVLLHISSLPSKYGIGTLGKSAYDFVDTLAKSDQSYWQILPLVQPAAGDSPYQSYEIHAGNPYFIDFDLLKDDGLLVEEDYCNDYWGIDGIVDYKLLSDKRYKVLYKAYNNFKNTDKSLFYVFLNDNKWVYDYSLFMTLKESFNGEIWDKWPAEFRNHDNDAIDSFKNDNKNEIEFWQFVQYEFINQWSALKSYANSKGIKIIGDCPIYLAYDSVEVWMHPEMFLLDENRHPTVVAGCPPDDFCKDGQVWGSPIYNYAKMELDGYNWWINRLAFLFDLYDVVRIDHFRGFSEYYSIPADHPNASFGHWENGPGMRLFNSINYWLGKKDIIAEDLGTITPSVRKLLEDTGYPGMKVMQFAFDIKGSAASNEYLPHNYITNCVAYIGTHDNDTALGWYSSLDEDNKLFVRNYIGNSTYDELTNDLIRNLESSVSDVVIVTMQDILGLKDARMNTPSTIGCNWKWRLKPEDIKEDSFDKLALYTKIYGRS